ncbi:MAG: response regulator [Candidatus Nomurabacteria bacterium]|nr:MAG: response regulator [Candidatus Nomurabacteria bacterium]
MANIILICEDEEFVARSYIRKLELEGFSVKHARNGQGALDMMKGGDVDLVLLDLMMPLKSGFDVLAEIQNSNDESFKKVPIIVASNLGQKSDIEEAKRLGAVDFIVKSNVSLKELVEKIRKYINK